MKNILFVCVENSCRSQIAEAFAKIYGKDVIKSYSSGSKPSGIVNKKAIATMKEVGYDLTSHNSKSLTEIPDVEYEYAITMGCGDECPYVKAKYRDDWKIDDPKHMNAKDFANIRDIIKDKVINLINTIK